MIIITGGAGFIGSSLIHRLNCAGIDDIRIVDRLGTDSKWKNLVNLRFSDYFDCDDFISDLDKTRKPRLIIHLGACSTTYEKDCGYLMKNNFEYSKKLCKWAIRNQIRFVYASSAATYGKGENGFCDSIETAEKLRPINPYGYSKQIFDLWLIRKGYIDKVLGLKFFNVYGPNEYHKGEMRSMVYKAYKQIVNSSKVRLFKSYNPDFKDGMQKRDFIYIQDVVEVIEKVMDNESAVGFLNVGTGNPMTFIDLTDAVFQALKKVKVLSFIDIPEDLRENYQYFTEADTKKLKQFHPEKMMSLNKAIKDYVGNYLEYKDMNFGSVNLPGRAQKI
ncbi:ADP-glyceromanno-heptose 6-epimerase [bacterium]|nr:ADP-glyceromanno-heptose 6-epimerase [bacterium]